MLSFRRALIIAAACLTIFFLLRSSHSASSAAPSLHDEEQAAEILGAKKDLKASTGSAEGLPKAKSQTLLAAQADMSGRSLYDQLAYYFPYDMQDKFPAYIWQTWKYTPASGDFGESFRPAEASWTEQHPTFVHEVITDNVATHLIRYLYSAMPDVIEAYQALPLPVLKADFFRYLILLARGGIYSDIDTFALKSAIDWVPNEVNRSTYGMVIGIEADPDREDWRQWYSRRIQFCQWTIQAKPGHPVLLDIVSKITQETLKRKQTGKLNKSLKSIVEFTGPAIWTDSVFRYFNDPRYFDTKSTKGNVSWEHFTGIKEPRQLGDIVVLPITGFSPGVGQMGSEEPDHPSACVKHEFEGQAEIDSF
ncbi:MAG: membrane-bound alpha-1,6- mannosyltransferase Initiation-specific [Vezdaea aestivalis]|nr:MAG: membrane-bound alpha-1,6- mannosyltransferase Initiation-specific [Vezdaea aestivalis]